MLACVDNSKIEKFQRAILDYWNNYGRKNLPWRLTQSPWHILLAEVLLRKTTSRQVERIYDSLSILTVEQVRDLTEVKLEDILKPLGMYRVRAKQIHTLATIISDRGEKSWEDIKFLDELPGIGRYARSTLLCFAFNLPKPALDTNMIRVVSRVFGVESKRSRAREDKDFWIYAEALVPHDRCREFNWGVLDLANSICKARNPKHDNCPLRGICDFNNGENTTQY